MDIKKFKKKLLMILFILLNIFPKYINALTYEDYMIVGERIPNIYIKKVADIGLKWVIHGEVLKRKSDNHWVYGIEPGMEISNSLYLGITEDIPARAYITEEEWNKISLLAYYGYNYIDEHYNHLDIKWYTVTQLLIWRALRPTWDIYFTDKLNGNKLPDKFQEEIMELNNLVDNHNRLPDFTEKFYSVLMGETLTLIDQNNLINDFELKHNKNLNITKNNNKLIIEPKVFGNYEIEIYKSFNKYSQEPLVYINDYLDTMIVGNLKENSIKINVSVHASKINIQKMNYNSTGTVNSNNCSLENSIYKIYDENDIVIDEIITDCNGFAQSNFISKYGKYYLLEHKASHGYQLDLEKHYFEINENNLNPQIVLYAKTENNKEVNNSINKNSEIINVDIPVTGMNTIKIFNNYIFIVPGNYYEKKQKKS